MLSLSLIKRILLLLFSRTFKNKSRKTKKTLTLYRIYEQQFRKKKEKPNPKPIQNCRTAAEKKKKKKINNKTLTLRNL